MFLARRWCVTLNNPHANVGKKEYRALRARYLVSGHEVGENGTHHLQMYIEFSSPVRMSAIKKVLGNAHCEAARGAAIPAANYCMKDQDFVEFGKLSDGGQGKRTDIESLRDSIAEGSTDREIVETKLVGPWVRYQRGVQALRSIYDAPSARDDIKVALFFGAPGMIF